MPSLKFQISSHVYDKSKYLRKSQKITDHTAKQYKNHAIKFGEWCKDRYGCRTFEECGAYIQDYADDLTARGLAASSIHTYIVAVCRIWEVPMYDIRKPIRKTAENSRSRGAKAVDQRSDAQRSASPRLYDFAEKVGLRRREYQRLKGGDLVRDESGQLCVKVKGKGGKVQYQRILPEDAEFVQSCFDGKADDEYLFPKAELNNKIDLHHLRAQQAQRAYTYYLRRLEDPSYRDVLTQEIRERWKGSGKKWSPKLVEGNYHLRGDNRKLALAHGLPTSYSRLALLAVSVFHLSHWRLDVTVANYLLAV